MLEPGAIKHLERFKQPISFDGMKRLRGIMPTDIDIFIDYGGNACIYADTKLKGKHLEIGQKIAFENLVKNNKKAGIECVVFVCEHATFPDEIIIAKDCYVVEIYWGEHLGKDVSEKGLTLLEYIEKFEQYCINRGIKL